MSDENQQLKLCDHCHGAKVKVHSITGDRGTLGFFCQCDFCWIRTIKYSSRQEAIDSWNNHIESPHQVVATLRAELESAKAEVKDMGKTILLLQENISYLQDQLIFQHAEHTATRAKLEAANGEVASVEEELVEIDGHRAEMIEEYLKARSALNSARAYILNPKHHSEKAENEVMAQIGRIFAVNPLGVCGLTIKAATPSVAPMPSPTIPAALLEKLEGAVKEADKYLDYNEMTSIGHGSWLHREFKSALADLQAFRNGGKV